MTEKPFSREHIVTPEDRDRMLISGCQDGKDRALLVCLAFGGMRVGEVAHVNASWWNGTEMKVPKQMPCTCRTCASRGFWKPKSRKGVRSIPIRTFYRPFLNAFLKASPSGFGLTTRSIERRLNDIALRAGLSIKVFPHCLRATLASEFLAAGLSEAFMIQFFGWVKFETAAFYSNLDAKMKQELSDKGLL